MTWKVWMLHNVAADHRCILALKHSALYNPIALRGCKVKSLVYWTYFTPTLKQRPDFLHLLTLSLFLSHTHMRINTSCCMLHHFSSKGWDAAPPSILYTSVHCLFKSHTVTKTGRVSTGERRGIRRESDQGGTCYHSLSSIRLHGSQWDYCSLFGLECGKTDLTWRKTDSHD